MSPREELKLEGMAVAVGKTVKMLCPFCEGGAGKEVSLSLTRLSKGTCSFKCHRAKCGKAGYINADGSGGDHEILANSFTPKPYPGKAHTLSLEDMQRLDEKYGLNLEMVYSAGWMMGDSASLQYIFPVFSPIGALRGHVTRTEKASGSKEIRSWKILDEPWLSWYRTAGRDIVVVEDQISALKACSFTTSVSLLGSSLSIEKMEEILTVAKGAKIWLAYDKDASSKTFEALKEYRALCDGNLNGLMLSKDVKNMTYEEIRKLGGPFA